MNNGIGPLDDGDASQPRAIGNVVEYVEQPAGGQMTTLFILHPKNTSSGKYLDASRSDRFNGATSIVTFQRLAGEPLQTTTPFVSAQGQALDVTFFKNSQGQVPADAIRVTLTSMITLLGRARQSVAFGGEFLTVRDGLVRSASTPGTADYLTRVFGPRPIDEECREDSPVHLNDDEAEMGIQQVAYLLRQGQKAAAELARQEIMATEQRTATADVAGASGSGAAAASSAAGSSASASQAVDQRFEPLMKEYVALQQRLGAAEECRDEDALSDINNQVRRIHGAVNILNEELQATGKPELTWIGFITKAFEPRK